MKIQIFSLKPYFNIEGHFTNILNQPTFDPKHPITYPGAEIKTIETLTPKEAQNKYGRYINKPHQVHNSGSKNCTVTIFEYTGKTSADIIQEHK